MPNGYKHTQAEHDKVVAALTKKANAETAARNNLNAAAKIKDILDLLYGK